MNCAEKLLEPTQHNCFYPVFNVLYILFNTIIFYSFFFPYTFCTVALRRIPPASNPREGVLQYRKKEKKNILCITQEHFSQIFKSVFLISVENSVDTDKMASERNQLIRI